MLFYHNPIYESILNTKWFLWSAVGLCFAFNLILPVWIWFLFSDKPIPFLNKKKPKAQGQRQQKP